KGIFEPKYFENLNPDISYDKFDLFHLISPPLPVIKKLRKFKKPVIYHWIGTDVYRLLNDSLIKKISKKYLLKSSGVINLVVSENLKDELNSLGITSEILPLVKLKFINEIPPLPAKFTVLAYIPEKSWDYYNGDIILKLAENFPDIDFHIVASGERYINLKNVFMHGFRSELNSLGITSEILPLVKLKFINEIPPLPAKFTVLAYIPEKSWDYYNGDIILKLAENFPDIDFHIVASGERYINLKNVFMHGFIEDLTPFYKSCSALIRLTVHDGLPKMVLEALSFGRQVLWSGALPHCFKTATLEECINVLVILKENPEVNSDGKKYVEKNFNPEIISEDYYNFCKRILAEYSE